MAIKNRIFLAHASEDKARVQQLYNQLKKRGFSPWLDSTDLIPGQNWEIEIPKAIKRASVCLVCLSKNSVAKEGYVQREFRYALLAYAELPPESIYLIPVRLDDCEVPDLRIPDLELKLRSIHWVDLFEMAGFEHLVSAIEKAVEPTKRYQSLSKDSPDPTAEIESPRLPRLRQKPVIITALIVAGAAALFEFSGSPLLDGLTDIKDDRTPKWEDTAVPNYQKTETQLFDSPVLTKNVKAGSEPFDVFRDCDHCPEMVMLPEGTFLIGSPFDETGRDDDEGPQQEVTIGAAFAIGKTEVTFEEYDRFAVSTEQEKPNDHFGRGRGKVPVFNVTWYDARAYCRWLGEQTRETYRLPSEAEWEYAARAGTTEQFSFGKAITSEQVNYNGDRPYDGHKKELFRSEPVPAGSLPANAWGLHEMHGNVSEWVQDWYHSNYEGAPSDGGAWNLPSGNERVLRGGSWLSAAEDVRAAARYGDEPEIQGTMRGFRCARDL